MGFSRQTLGSSYLTTSNDSGASIGAARRMAAIPQQLIDTLILSMGRRCETCLAKHNPDAPHLEDLTDDEETSSACETEHQEERQYRIVYKRPSIQCIVDSPQRKKRVTSSTFWEDFTLQNWAKRFGGANLWQEFFKCCVIDWRKNPEAVAIQQFLTYLSNQHVKGMFLSCGLLVDKENIFLGATPDGLVMCDCCETDLLEIKCPARG
ncbi:hypothetical protein TNCV_2839431 [Trichonephila clavipes]|nr:hypothetical protein TNCV_2839431 [Trichonephila clavipes]